MLFEQASRLKLRYGTARGNIAVEDLWDLPLTSTTGFDLDTLAKALNRAIKQSEEESFVVTKNAIDALLELRFDLVKHVIEIKLDEAKQQKNAVTTRLQKEKILNIIANKEDEKLKGESLTKLKKMVEEL